MFIARMFLGDKNKGCKIVKIRKSYNFNPSIVIFKKKNYSVRMTVLRWITSITVPEISQAVFF